MLKVERYWKDNDCDKIVAYSGHWTLSWSMKWKTYCNKSGNCQYHCCSIRCHNSHLSKTIKSISNAQKIIGKVNHAIRYIRIPTALPYSKRTKENKHKRIGYSQCLEQKRCWWLFGRSLKAYKSCYVSAYSKQAYAVALWFPCCNKY